MTFVIFQEDYETNVQNREGRYGEYVTAPQTDTEGVVAVCRALYETSAQCNMHMKNFQQISLYMSQYEIDVEKRNCAFIDNIIEGSYDENGAIQMSPESFSFADWRNPQQYKKLKMPASQAIFLSLSIILCIAAAAAAIYTQRSLTRSKSSPWQGKRPSGVSSSPLI